MCHSCKNESVRKIGHKRKNVEQLEKYVTFKKIVSQLEFVLELEKMCQTSKMCHSKKSRSQLGKRVTIRRMCHCQKMSHSQNNGSQLQICVIVRKYASIRKLGYNYKNGSGSDRKMLYSQENRIEKYVTMKKIVKVNVRKMGQRKICYSQKNVSQLEKWVTVGKMCHSQKHM